ncbi:prevent-host-death protein [Thermoanaerobacterium thermosaccharolyticum]|uniref:Antitoxin n=1 Tax=Thermoanaerobacterium thermosaccharolyticum TaxID=1517 RepID=A0A223HXW1_THETR|nr:type II toxin-antitoxin system Phd/YefM family antitoxin [Thermoanaerobacterium thermosaccharolyticum]AST57124.1 prevent-host-death protein [Thermoanaerobacterium thermosaccharolyticum]
MPHIRPVSDLRNNFADISRIVHETQEPVFLTKNGYGDMVVMSMEAYERKLFKSEIYFKLKEAELEAKTTDTRYFHKEVFDELRARLADKLESDEV